MEFLILLTAVITLVLLWFGIGCLAKITIDAVHLYFKGNRYFNGDAGIEHPMIVFGPLMLVWILYPIWALVAYVAKNIWWNSGFTVVVENVREYQGRNYKHICMREASTKSLSNFFNAYMEDQDKKFYASQGGDKNALENFFRVDGWRSVGDGKWTKIVRLKEVNCGE